MYIHFLPSLENNLSAGLFLFFAIYVLAADTIKAAALCFPNSRIIGIAYTYIYLRKPLRRTCYAHACNTENDIYAFLTPRSVYT